MNFDSLYIYYRKGDKEIVKNEQKIDQRDSSINPYYGEDEAEEIYEEIPVKIIEKKETKKIYNFNYGISNSNQPTLWLDKGSVLVTGGYYNGHIIVINMEKISPVDLNNINANEDNHHIYIYKTNEFSPITKIVTDKYETFAICGNVNGTICIFKIDESYKYHWSLYHYFNVHNCLITSIAIHETLNIAITCSKNGLCMLYSLPSFQIYNSFIIGKDDKETKEEEPLCPDIVLISDKPLPCFIFYVNTKKCIYFYSINGYFLKKHHINYTLRENMIKIYTDDQFVDYLLIYDNESKAFDLYSMIDFVLINRSPDLLDCDFVDYIFSDEIDHALILCKIKDSINKYKILMLKDSGTQHIWK